MASVAKLDGWFARLGTLVGLWQALPPTIVAGALAYASSSVTQIAAYGTLGWLCIGLAAFVAASAAQFFLSKARFLRVESRSRERLLGQGSDFDPMARVYENKRLYLRDLVPLGRREVAGKHFINCELIGPGNVLLGLRSSDQKPWPNMRASRTYDVDCVQVDLAKRSMLAISFVDCDFEGCSFYHMTLLFGSRDNESLNWITPAAFEATQLQHQTGGEQG